MGTVYVAGAAVMDVIAHADHHPRTGETLIGHDLGFFPGGKGYNQAIASARIGVPTWFMGAVGADSFGRELRAYLEAEGINTTGIYTVDRPTGTALINVDPRGEVAVNAIYSANELASPAILLGFTPRRGDVLISGLEIPYETVIAFFEQGRAVGAKTVVNLAPARACDPRIIELADIVVLHENDLGFFAGTDVAPGSSAEDIATAATKMLQADSQWIVTTVGARGLIAVSRDDVLAVPAHPGEVRNTIGAGDCFVGSMGARLAQDAAVEAAIRYGNAAASLSVRRDGAGPSMPFGNEVAEVLSS